MSLVWIILAPLVGALVAWPVGRRRPKAARWVSLAACAAQLGIAVGMWASSAETLSLAGGPWLANAQWPWIEQLGASIHLAADGLSLLMLLLTGVLGLMAVAASWNVTYRAGFFHANLLAVLAGVAGVFVAMDMLVLYFFWELMLVPMYLLIDIWGHEGSHRSAIKFFIFTQVSGLLMLLAILGLYFVHGRATGNYTFDYFELLGTTMSPATATWLMMGFLAAFLVKLPALGLHTWLPDAHSDAPTAGSVLLAGLLLKTGAYGLLRFAVPLLPQAAEQIAPYAMAVGAAGVVYGAVLAFAQDDIKRLVAYTSVSHMGFVLLGVFAWNAMALRGAVMQMICHGLSTGALFILAGALGDRLGTRSMARMGGLWAVAPRMGGCAMFFALASLGLPGLGNFVAEMLVLLGAWNVAPVATAVAAAGLVFATVYSLVLIQRVFHGRQREASVCGVEAPHIESATGMSDLNFREMAMMLTMAGLLVWLGMFPQSVLDTAGGALGAIQSLGPHGGAP